MPAEIVELGEVRARREERRDIALLELFSAVLSRPLERRELTEEQRALRAARLRAREEVRDRALQGADFRGGSRRGIIEL